MRIEEIDAHEVIVRLTPGDALLFADACRRAAQDCQGEEEHRAKHIYNLAASHMEGLALIAQAQGLVVENTAFLADWTLAHVREHWAVIVPKGEGVQP